jgi:hypothetical protein
MGIDLRSFHWVKIVFLPSDFVEDPQLICFESLYENILENMKISKVSGGRAYRGRGF